MRKAMSVAFVLLLSSALAGCGGSSNSSSVPDVPDSIPISTSVAEPQQSVISSSILSESSSIDIDTPATSDIMVSNVLIGGKPVAVSSEDVAVIQTLLAGYEWRSDLPPSDCINDCLLSMFGEDVYYHTDCGTLNNWTNNTCIPLDDAGRDSLNQILQKYITFGLAPPRKEG